LVRRAFFAFRFSTPVHIGPLRPAPAHPIHRILRGWLSAYAGGFTFTTTRKPKRTALLSPNSYLLSPGKHPSRLLLSTFHHSSLGPYLSQGV